MDAWYSSLDTLTAICSHGWIFVFKREAKNGRIDYVATNMENPTREKIIHIMDSHWSVEAYHHEIKQTCGI